MAAWANAPGKIAGLNNTRLHTNPKFEEHKL